MSDRPEFALIEWIRRQAAQTPEVVLGIGNDAAGLRTRADRETLVATDMLLEGVHFEFSTATPELAGRKALAVNLSDIAAMGGRAVAAFVSIALPRGRGPEFGRRVHQGLLQLADEWGVCVAGGDTNTWDGPLVINVAVVGETLLESSVRRSGARPGDRVFVTGSLGGSIGGRHLSFQPRLAEAAELLGLVRPTSMIDVSDGLAGDFPHLLEESGVGGIINEANVPISLAARDATNSRSYLDHALGDGEDFELLFTVTAADAERLPLRLSNGTPLTEIGEITGAKECLLRKDGSLHPFPVTGYTHRWE